MIKFIFHFTAISLILILLSSCQQEKALEPNITLQYPIASFTYTGNDRPPPVTIQFVNKSETSDPDNVTYTWTFGEDGPQSNLKDPSFTFNNAGSQPKLYLVTLKVTDLVSNLSQARSLSIEIQGSQK